MTVTKPLVGVLVLCGAMFMVGLTVLADDSNAEKPSTFAPANDLQRQVTVMLGELDEDLKVAESYNIPRIKRVMRNANTIAAVAMVLGQHDEANELRASSADVVEASLSVAKNARDYAAAKTALETLKKVIDTLPKGPQTKWRAIGDSEQLMLQVPVLSGKLRSCVRGTAFAESRDKATALSATLAAVAQVSEFDHSYCKDEKDQRDWETLCRFMRDAAAHCNEAVHAGDRKDAKDALKDLTLSCDKCHDQFRTDDR